MKNNNDNTTLQLGGYKDQEQLKKILDEALESNIYSFCLTCFKTNGQGLSYISDFLGNKNSLTDICVSETNTGNEIPEILVSLKYNSLTALSFINNEIDDDGLLLISEVLQNNTAITRLNLLGNKIGEGWQSLSNALKVNTSLHSLILDWNNITPEKLKIISECKNNSLTNLSLQANPVEKGLKDLLNNWKSIATLDLTNADLKDNEFLGIGVYTSLTKLNLRSNNIKGNGLKEVINNFPLLTSLNVGNNELKNEDLKGISFGTMPLTDLNFAGNRISHRAAKYLSDALKHNTTLTSLNFCDNHDIWEEKIVRDSFSISSLKSIYLSGEDGDWNILGSDFLT